MLCIVVFPSENVLNDGNSPPAIGVDANVRVGVLHGMYDSAKFGSENGLAIRVEFVVEVSRVPLWQ